MDFRNSIILSLLLFDNIFVLIKNRLTSALNENTANNEKLLFTVYVIKLV